MRPKAHQRLELQQARPDWNDTLKRIGECCAVLSVDTAVAHLSAGSERPTLLLGNPRLALASSTRGSQAPLWYPSVSVDLQTSSQRCTLTLISGHFKVRRWLIPVFPETVFLQHRRDRR